MNPSPFRPLAALAAVFLLAISCMNPSNTGFVGSGDARLVFSFTASRADLATATLADVGFLTVRVTSKDDGTVRYGQASKAADGTFAIDFKGMIAGDWDMRVLLYDSAVSAQLLFFTSQTIYIAVGKTTTPALEVYKAGAIGPITITVNNPVSVAVGDSQGTAATPAQERTVRLGTELSLGAVVWGDAGTALVNQGVTWESNSGSVQVKDGRVKTLGMGKAVITARSVLGSNIMGQFCLNVISPVTGYWKSISITDPYGGGTAPAPGLYFRFLENGTVEEYLAMGGATRSTGTWSLYDGAVEISLTQTLDPVTGTMVASSVGSGAGFQGFISYTSTSSGLSFTVDSGDGMMVLNLEPAVEKSLTGVTFLPDFSTTLTAVETVTLETLTPTDATVPAIVVVSSDPAVLAVTETSPGTWTLTPTAGPQDVTVTITVHSLTDLSVLKTVMVLVPGPGI